MSWTEADLIRKKEEITKAKSKLSELKGEENALLKQLKNDFECSSLLEAKKQIRTWEKEVETLTEDIQTKTTQLEEKFINNQEE